MENKAHPQKSKKDKLGKPTKYIGAEKYHESLCPSNLDSIKKDIKQLEDVKRILQPKMFPDKPDMGLNEFYKHLLV